MKKHTFSLRLIALLICAAVSIAVFYYPKEEETVSAHWEELRGVWVSTVANIDYPSRQTTDPEPLKRELISILDNCKDMGFNAVFFQVRPSGDALYKSEIFPWSRYLTGEQGQAPDNGFDPLAFAVQEAHARGIELHAWINPYRITNSASEKSRLCPENPAVKNPNLVLTDSEGKMYYNPGDEGSVDLIVKGAVEIVSNYDVDGLHMDDYFYPTASFDDSTTYSYYKDQYPDIGNWRRAMVNNLVKKLDDAVHRAKPDVEFGISPRGIWANKSVMAEGSDTNGGGSYDQIFADSHAWVKNGWVDYIMPQIYWNIGYKVADYAVLAKWWGDLVEGTDVRLYTGEGAYRTTTSTTSVWKGQNGVDELRKHIEIGRNNDNISGYCMFTYNNFMENGLIYDLMKEVNKTPSQQIGGESVAPKPTQEPEPTEDVPQLSGDGEGDKPQEGEYQNKFTDIDKYWWAKDSIYALASQGIIKGRSETEFDPDAYITRADYTVLLLRVLGKKTDFKENFADVYPSKYYFNEIGMAKELGIVSGVGDNLFDPDNVVRRQDMATMAYRVLSKEGVMTSIPNTAGLNMFKDKKDIDFYARDAMAACVGAKLMSGYGDNTINPKGNATRIEVVLFMHRIQNLIKTVTDLME